MPGFDSALLSAILGAALGLGGAFLIRRWLGARRTQKAVIGRPKVYASRQEMRKDQRARMKAERSARKRAAS